MSGRDHTPNLSVASVPLMDLRSQPPMFLTLSGEITSGEGPGAVGSVRTSGRIREVSLSVGASGKDDSNTLSVAAEVYINGTSCLSTAPSIAHVSGEASQQKTTRVSGDTGTVQAVIDSDNANVAPGDVITAGAKLTRTPTPTTEISNVIVEVEFEPLMATPAAH